MILSLLCAAALAGDADALLARVDEASNRGDDAHLVLEVTTTEKDGEPAQRTLEIWQRGEQQRRIQFTAPARLAGVAMLVPDGDTLYLYLPSYGRVRRVVGQSQGDAFLGTDFAMEDLARISWASDFTPTLTEPGHLTLTPKDAKQSASSRVELWVDEATGLPARVEHYDRKDALARRITFSDLRNVGEHPLSHHITVEDLESSRTTTAVVQAAAFDQGLEEDLFSVHNLSR